MKKYSIFKFHTNNLKVFNKTSNIYVYFNSKNRVSLLRFKNIIIKEKLLEIFIFSKKFALDQTSYFQNILKGLHCFYKRILEIKGIGYKFDLIKHNLVIDTGLSHSVILKQPVGLQFILKKNKIKIIGFDLNQISQLASKIRSFKKIDRYKGKGIRYLNEYIVLKQGKKKKR